MDERDEYRLGENAVCRLLGVPPNASPREINGAYRKLAWVFHPDGGMRPDTVFAGRTLQAWRQKLNGAEEILSDKHRRTRHEGAIRRQGSGKLLIL